MACRLAVSSLFPEPTGWDKRRAMSQRPNRKVNLFYVDERLDRPEVEEALSLVWEEICLVEYDYLYGGFRGVHMNEEETKLSITFQLSSGGLDNAVMAVLDRTTKAVDFAPAPKEILQKEIDNLRHILGVKLEDLDEKDLADRLRSVEELAY